MSWKTLNNASGDVDLPTKAEMDAQRGLPNDAAWDGSASSASHTSIFKRMANFLTTLGSLGDAAWDGTSSNPSIVAVLKRQAALLSDTTAAKVDTVVQSAAVDRGLIIGFAGTATAASSASTTLTVTVLTTQGVPAVGQVIAGTGIPAGTTITAVSGTAPSYSLTLSAAATVASGATVTGNPGSVSFVPALATRRGFAVRNLSATGNIWINGLGAATADYHSLLVKPGEYYDTPPSHTGTGEMFIISDTGGVAVYARVW